MVTGVGGSFTSRTRIPRARPGGLFAAAFLALGAADASAAKDKVLIKGTAYTIWTEVPRVEVTG
jgi:hypothetical protein